MATGEDRVGKERIRVSDVSTSYALNLTGFD
jgi:hypothetical protein